MDEFENRLKEDANALKAEVSSELRMRIDASLRGAETAVHARRNSLAPVRWWWVSSLSGLAATFGIIAFVNFNNPASAPGSAPVARTVPDTPNTPIDFPWLSPNLDLQSAEFESPLEEELLKLQADIERARLRVREDVDFSF